MNYQELNIDNVVIRPTHLENLKEIERLILEKEARNGIDTTSRKRVQDSRTRTA